MLTEWILQVLNDAEECLAKTSVLFVNEPLKPIPAIGDGIVLAYDGVNYRGTIFARDFDFSEIDENNPDSRVRITIDARSREKAEPVIF